DVECVAQGGVEVGSLDLAERADRAVVERRLRYRQEAVAVDDARLGESFVGADVDLRVDVSDRPGDRRARHGGENRNGAVPRQDTDRASIERRAERGPVDLAPSYQPGGVSAASRSAASTTDGSCGCRR